MILLVVGCDLTSAPNPGDTTEILYDVRQASTARGIADELATAGLVAADWRWEWFLRTEGDGSCLKAGKHRVHRAMSAPELLAALCGAPVPNDQPFTIVEGWRVRDIDAALVAKGFAEAGEYTTAVTTGLDRYTATFPLPTDTLEGYLYPETYKIEPDRFEPHDLVQRQLNTFDERFYHAAGATLTRALHDIVVMASMIEREEPTPANRPLIAGILWKRVDAGWNLGVDATSRYTLDDWNDRDAFMVKLRDPKDPWNTRLRPGLPPTAIGNPSVIALTAAAAPQTNEFWYYLHDSSQTIHPSRNVAEHERFRRTYNVY